MPPGVTACARPAHTESKSIKPHAPSHADAHSACTHLVPGTSNLQRLQAWHASYGLREPWHVTCALEDNVSLIYRGMRRHYVDDGYPVVAELVPNRSKPQAGSVMVGTHTRTYTKDEQTDVRKHKSTHTLAHTGTHIVMVGCPDRLLCQRVQCACQSPSVRCQSRHTLLTVWRAQGVCVFV